MKTAISSLGCTILLLIAILIINTVGSTAVRSDELNTAIDCAVVATQRALFKQKSSIQNDEDYKTEFTKNLLVQIDSKSDVDIVFYTADSEKGLLDVEVVEKYRYLYDEPDDIRTYSVRRTSIIDEIKR